MACDCNVLMCSCIEMQITTLTPDETAKCLSHKHVTASASMNLKGACGARKTKSCSVKYSSEEAPINKKDAKNAKTAANVSGACIESQSELLVATRAKTGTLELNTNAMEEPA